MKKRRIVRTREVNIETEEEIALSNQGQRSRLTWCPACRSQVEMVTPELAARMNGVSALTIYRWIEAGAVHFIEDCGYLLICVPTIRHAASHTLSTELGRGVAS